ncbi:MAG: 4Fe-4S binding protein [Pseudomonadota bacterium]
MKTLQRFSQIFSALFYNSYFYGFYYRNIYQGSLKLAPCPGLNCHSCPSAIFSCPVGAFQLFIEYGKYHIPFYIMGFIGAVGALGGRIVCGWACPFGFFQDVLYKIRAPKLEIHRIMNYGKYVILIILAICIPFITGEPWFCKLCPAGTLEAGIPLLSLNGELRDQAGMLFVLKIVILAAFIIWMIVSKRPFCRTVCPLGALYSLFNPISMVKIDVDNEKCIQCNHCFKKCPMSIKIYEEGGASGNCIRCFQCTTCPAGAVKFRFKLTRQPSCGSATIMQRR